MFINRQGENRKKYPSYSSRTPDGLILICLMELKDFYTEDQHEPQFISTLVNFYLDSGYKESVQKLFPNTMPYLSTILKRWM